MTSAPAADATQSLDVTLSARLGGRLLSGAITRTVRDPPVTASRWVPSVERGNKGFAVSFSVPAAWLALAVLSRDRLDIEASVSLPAGAGAGSLVECGLLLNVNCSTNNRFRLEGLPIVDDFPDLRVRSVPLLVGSQTLNSAASVLAKALEIFPGGDRVTVLPYNGSVDITTVPTLTLASTQCVPFRTPAPAPPAVPAADQATKDTRSCRIAAAAAAVVLWMNSDEQNRTGYNMLLATHRYPMSTGGGAEPGSQRGGTIAMPGLIPILQINDGSVSRPLTAAAHEYGHALTLPHAGQSCPDTQVGGPQEGEAWPSDDTGRLQGVTAEPKYVRLLRTLTTRVDGAPSQLFDLMSYCGGESNSWLSARNWNRMSAELRKFTVLLRDRGPLRPARAAQAAQALAVGVFGPAGAQIVRVLPGSSENLPDPPDPASPLKLRALSAGGSVLSETGVRLHPASDADAPIGSFAAGLPAEAASVQLVSGGAVLDTRQKSRSPEVRVRGVRVGRGVRVTWTASDPDGDPLFATVEYSPDAGRTWRHVFQGPSKGRATLRGAYLESSTRGRIRVTVNDGFSDATDESRAFNAAGSGPQATIVIPHTGDELQAGLVRFVGRGIDDHRRALRGRALTWFAGAKRLGTGEKLSARLKPGRVTIRLVAHDRDGRSGVATQKVTIAPVRLQIKTIGTSPRVRRGAKTMKLRIATTVPATLTAAGRRYSVNTKTRTVAIRLPSKPKTGLLTRPADSARQGRPAATAARDDRDAAHLSALSGHRVLTRSRATPRSRVL